ncbi:MAG TPA: efflux RND transporter periplasmic adaptor subunit [Anaerolineales bacterium]
MHPRRPPVPVIILLLIAIAAGIYYGLRLMKAESNGTLSASGSIEATTVNIAPEMAGKVAEVMVEEGQTVAKGDPLLRLDDSLLRAQRDVAAAAVETARSGLAAAQTAHDLAVRSALTSQQASQANDWRFSAPDEFNQPAWYFAQQEQLDAAQTEADAASTALQEANTALEQAAADLNNADFLAAERRLADARAAFLVADQVKTNADYAAEGGGLQKAADAAYNKALAELREAQNAYNAMLSYAAARTIQDARGAVVVAQQRYDAASARLTALSTGMESPAVETASKALEQAKSAVSQAEANLALLDTQMSKLEITSPLDGVILTRSVEPGEFVQPGAILFAVGQLSDLTITVYVPEDRYGEISLGQQAEVTVDSWPGQKFSGTVIRIADQAEFTPRNVQTPEGRSGTVYAVKLSVTDPEGMLKIGMPADVRFH